MTVITVKAFHYQNHYYSTNNRLTVREQGPELKEDPVIHLLIFIFMSVGRIQIKHKLSGAEHRS